ENSGGPVDVRPAGDEPVVGRTWRRHAVPAGFFPQAMAHDRFLYGEMNAMGYRFHPDVGLELVDAGLSAIVHANVEGSYLGRRPQAQGGGACFVPGGAGGCVVDQGLEGDFTWSMLSSFVNAQDRRPGSYGG